jgi:ubiquinone/menaquinone biosynthesis C-methylase UbiE
MKLTNVEKLVVCSPLRACTLRKIEAPMVLSNLDLGERSVCLDVGCGTGVGALLINQYLDCEQVVGIDIDPGVVAAAQKRIARPPRWARNIRTDNIEFLCQDATRLTFPDRYFDAVFLFGVLHHITEWKKVIAEVYRVLKGGGVPVVEDGDLHFHVTAATVNGIPLPENMILQWRVGLTRCCPSHYLVTTRYKRLS